MKWNVVRPYFLFTFFIYIIFAISLSSFALCVTSLKAGYEASLISQNLEKTSFADLKLAANPSKQLMEPMEIYHVYAKSPLKELLESSYLITCISLGILFFRNSFLMLFRTNDYASEKENFMEFLMLSFSLSFVVSSGLSTRVATHTGALAVLLTWAKLTLLIGRFPTFGIYIYMATQVFSTLILFFTLYMTTIIGE